VVFATRANFFIAADHVIAFLFRFIGFGLVPSLLLVLRRWRDLETYLTAPKSLFRSARLQAVIGFDRVVDVLSKNHAPPDVSIAYYPRLVVQMQVLLFVIVKLAPVLYQRKSLAASEVTASFLPE